MILSLGIDPSHRATAIALLDVEPARPRLLGVRVIQPTSERVCDWAYAASSAVGSLRKLAGDLSLAYVAAECNPPGRGFQAGAKIQQATGAVVQAMWHAEWDVARVDLLTTGRWCSLCAVPKQKNGPGLHRLGEARALVECSPAAFDGLGKADVDAAEAVLIAYAAKLSVEKPVVKAVVKAAKSAKAKKPKAERVAKPRVRKGRAA